MHRRILAALTATTVTVLGLSGATSGSAYADPLPPPDRHALAEAIAGLPDDAVTSAQVRVSGSDGRWAGRAGVRDVRTGRPVPADARFRIGSATKMFTASLVLQLAAEGRLGLDDPVQTWLPGQLPASFPTITVGQLLDHTSGLPKSTEDAGHEDPAWVVRHRFDWHSPRAVVRSATRQPMAFAPGTNQQYNGVNYFLAGLVVEAVTGHSYAHELRTRLLRPLALDDTYLPGRGEVHLRGPHTHGYVRVGDRLVDVTAQSAYAWAEGGMVSTTRDLGRFLGALMAGRVVPQPWLEPDADRARRALRRHGRRLRAGTGRRPRLLHGWASSAPRCPVARWSSARAAACPATAPSSRHRGRRSSAAPCRSPRPATATAPRTSGCCGSPPRRTSGRSQASASQSRSRHPHRVADDDAGARRAARAGHRLEDRLVIGQAP